MQEQSLFVFTSLGAQNKPEKHLDTRLKKKTGKELCDTSCPYKLRVPNGVIYLNTMNFKTNAWLLIRMEFKK